MHRRLAELTTQRFDVAVIGGGILGACVARDAALRGLSTALIEAGDFAGRTSANSLKVVHGGLRHLQHLDVPEVRTSARERATWLRIAPHLVEPLPVLMPLYGGAPEHLAYRLAVATNDLLTSDRNRGLPVERSIVTGRALGRDECVRHVPELSCTDVTGGVLFHDARMYSSERLVLAVVMSAVDAGAIAVNHVACTGALVENGRREGIEVVDRLGGAEFAVRARVVINASGPGAPMLTRTLLDRDDPHPRRLSLAWNLVLPGAGHEVAFALPGRAPTPTGSGSGTRPRRLFFVPWRDRLMVGTGHAHFEGDASSFRGLDRSHPELLAFVDEINRAWPGTPFRPEDALVVHAGLLPAEENARGEVQLRRRHAITVQAAGGAAVITATTVKFTAARRVAENAVDRACALLGQRTAASSTASTLLRGAPADGMSALARRAQLRLAGRFDPDVVDHLVHSYGDRYEEVVSLCDADPSLGTRVIEDRPVILAQFAYAVRRELACTVEDVLCRRTELVARGPVDDRVRRTAERVLAEHVAEVVR